MARRRRKSRRTKFVTKRALPFLLSRNAEAKRFTLGLTDHVLTLSTPLTQDYTAIPQGTEVSERIGVNIKVSGWVLKATLSIDPFTSLTRPSFTRFILWMPRGDISVSPPDVNPTEFPDPEKYIIWLDRTVPNPWTNSLSGSMITMRKRFKPYMNVVFDASGTFSVEKNRLQLLIVTDDTTGGLLLTVDSRVYFRDY